MAKCSACGKFLSLAEAVNCNKCRHWYHRVCVGISTGVPVANPWHCKGCEKHQIRDNRDETPVRSPAPTPALEDSLVNLMDTSPDNCTALDATQELNLDIFRAELSTLIPARSHVTPVLNKHLTLKMKSRRKLHLACLLFGIIKYKKPDYLYNKLSWIGSTRECDRRQCSQQLASRSHRTAAFRGSFRYAASKIWNNLPPPIRSSNSTNIFKKRLRLYLIDAQRKLDMVNMNLSLI